MPLSPECCWDYRHTPPHLVPSPYKDKQDCFKNSVWLVSLRYEGRAAGGHELVGLRTVREDTWITVLSPSCCLQGNLFGEERLSVALQQAWLSLVRYNNNIAGHPHQRGVVTAANRKGRLTKRTEDRLTSSNARKTSWVISTECHWPLHPPLSESVPYQVSQTYIWK